MKRLDRYVATQVLSAIFLVLLVILGLDFVFAFMDEIADASDAYDMPVILEYLLLRIPGRFYEFLPLSSLVGCLVGLGMLASHSELTVMRAAGISTFRIITSVLKPAIVLAFFSMAVGEFVVPVTEQVAQSKKALAKAGGKALHSQYGVWHREGNTFIHINAVVPGDRIEGVTRFEFNQDGVLELTSFAQSGRYLEDHWLLSNISQTTFHGDRTEVSQQRNEQWNMGLSPTLLAALVVEPRDLSLSALWSFSHYLYQQNLQSDSYFLAFWSKLFQPLTVIALVLIGILFIFGPLRSVTVGQRIIAGVITGLVFKFLQDILGQVSAIIGTPPLIAVLAPILICLLLGYVLLQRSKV
ncbi:MAG: LPS export ABC transporter permease LptG [Pseudomonadales bacterium]|nr:LPS export ABC transporter permease LptG [Pseudomonadales bacterium]NRA17383.1 LPS export ABC transporter permease LptG [Oceanospirillaceae bacterium]